MHTRIAARFWEGIETGKFNPWTTQEVSTLVEEMLGSSPLQELTARDREVISTVLREENSSYLNNSRFHQLASDQAYFFSTAKEVPAGADIPIVFSDKPFFFLPPSPCSHKIYEQYGHKELGERENRKFNSIITLLAKAGIKPVSRDEKKKILTNPAAWLNTGVSCINSAGNDLVGYGMRPLTAYGITPEQFLDTVKRVQTVTGKDKLNVLDVGGANGLALHDARQLTDAVITHNLTSVLEPVMYPVDYVYHCPAERMPASLRESMDLILSNYAFCYFPGQDLALENILQALSVGGEANIDVSFGKQKAFVDDHAARMADQYRRMKQLHDQGYIDLKVKSSWNPHPLDFPVSQGNFYPPAGVHIRKIKSLIG